MIVVRFKDKREHKEIKHKLKEMKEFIDDLCEIIEERAEEDEEEYRGGRYRDDWDEMHDRDMIRSGRYEYRRGGGRSRM